MTDLDVAGAPEDLAAPMVIQVGDQAMVVRRAEPGDVDGLLALYRELGPDDRYRRFFSGVMPPRATIERWVCSPGSTVLVVEVDGQIVAEAGVARTPNGRDELGMAVARRHRGWLGPFLLDRLLALAAASGSAAVEAEVLATNRPMLALMASRGTALLPSGDPSVVRLLLGTSGPVPGWSAGAGAPPGRVLLELGTGGSPAADALAEAGYAVVLCRGPSRTGVRARHWRCPLLDGQPCPLVGGADVVVTPGSPCASALDAQVLAALPHVHPTTVRATTRPRPTPSEVVDSVLGAIRRARR